MRSTVPPDRRSQPLQAWPRLLLAIVVGAAMVAACSGGGSTPAPAGSGTAVTSPAESVAPAESAAAAASQAPAGSAAVDVCTMLSVADVKRITGEDTVGAVEGTSDWADWVAGECWWNNATMTVRFGIDVGTPASIAKSSSPTAKEQYDILKQALVGLKPESIPGLGEGAFFTIGQVYAYKGGAFVSVFGNLPKDQAAAITELVLAKL